MHKEGIRLKKKWLLNQRNCSSLFDSSSCSVFSWTSLSSWSIFSTIRESEAYIFAYTDHFVWFTIAFALSLNESWEGMGDWETCVEHRIEWNTKINTIETEAQDGKAALLQLNVVSVVTARCNFEQYVHLHSNLVCLLSVVR